MGCSGIGSFPQGTVIAHCFLGFPFGCEFACLCLVFWGWVWVFWAKQRPIIFSCRPWGTAAAVKEEEEEEVLQAQ